MARKKIGDFHMQIVVRATQAQGAVATNEMGPAGDVFNTFVNVLDSEWGSTPEQLGSNEGEWHYAGSSNLLQGAWWMGRLDESAVLDVAAGLDSDEYLVNGAHTVGNKATIDESRAIEAAQEKVSEFLSGLNGEIAIEPPTASTFTVSPTDEGVSITDGPEASGLPDFSVSRTEVFLAALAKITKAYEDFSESMEVEVPNEWVIDTYEPGSYLNYVATKTISVSLGEIERGFTAKVPLYHDDVTNEIIATTDVVEGLALGSDDPLAKALTAKADYDDSLAEGVAVFKDTGSTLSMPVKERPSETLSADLPAEDAAKLDTWWSGVLSIHEDVEKESERLAAEEGTPYEQYVADGGTDSEEEWLSGQETPSVPSTEDNPSDFSWWSTVKDGASWLGDSTMSLLEQWGPHGVVGTYAGIKATDTVAGSDNKLLLIGGVALLALVLFS